MLAAMIRSAKLVTFLLQKGALWHIKDRHGYTAVKYTKGRYADRMRLRYRKFIKRGTTKDTTRQRDVYTYLKDPSLLHTQYRTKPAGTLSFQRHGRSLRIFKLIKKVKLAGKITQNTTSACIAPGNTTKPQMCAVSGSRIRPTCLMEASIPRSLKIWPSCLVSGCQNIATTPPVTILLVDRTMRDAFTRYVFKPHSRTSFLLTNDCLEPL